MQKCTNCNKLNEDTFSYCEYCGFELTEPELFCKKCGTKLNKKSEHEKWIIKTYEDTSEEYKNYIIKKYGDTSEEYKNYIIKKYEIHLKNIRII